MIKRPRYSSCVGGALALLVVTVVVSVGVYDSPTVPAEVESAGQAARDGAAQGISVHGHWVIEVYDPDGTMAQRTEFDNALTPSGAAILGQVLAGERTVEPWSVSLLGNVCLGADGLPAGCFLEPATFPLELPNRFKTLTVESVTAGLAFSGNMTAHLDGAINLVVTTIVVNDNGTTSGSTFTTHALSPGTPVLAGQSVSVTINITFS